MNWPVPVIEKIRWVYPPPNSTLPSNNLRDDKLKELDDTVTDHEARLSNVTTFSKIYAKKDETFKFEYEQMVIALERTVPIITHFKRLENETQAIYAHIIN